MLSIFMVGFCVGVLLPCLVVAALLRCRLRFHKWERWQIAVDGNSQYRVCKECGYYSVEMFRDFTVRRVQAVGAECGNGNAAQEVKDAAT